MTPAPKPESLDPSQRPVGPRRAARLAAVQALYQIEMMAADPERVILEFLTERQGVTLEGDEVLEIDRDFFSDLARGASRRRRELDRVLSRGLAADWRLERLEAVLLAILRVAAYELSIRRDVPVKVAINEYVEVTHAFFAPEQCKFVNAILDRIAHEVRAAEFAEKSDGRPAEAG